MRAQVDRRQKSSCSGGLAWPQLQSGCSRGRRSRRPSALLPWCLVQGHRTHIRNEEKEQKGRQEKKQRAKVWLCEAEKKRGMGEWGSNQPPVPNHVQCFFPPFTKAPSSAFGRIKLPKLFHKRLGLHHQRRRNAREWCTRHWLDLIMNPD